MPPGAHVVVELWRARLDLNAVELAACERVLSDEERARARLLRGEPWHRYVADHGARRRLLAGRLGCRPAEIEFTIGKHGKPRLTSTGPSFSASRTASVALYAICEHAEVGVDVEQVHDGMDVDGLADRVLSGSERAALRALPDPGRAAALTACWARKEAYLKALGSGIVFPLSDVEVWAGDDRPVRLGEVVVHGVALAAGLAAAVGVRVGAEQTVVVSDEVRWAETI